VANRGTTSTAWPTLRVPRTSSAQSSGVFVLVEDSAQAIMPMDVKMLDRGWVGDRLGQRM
jgi:hypothetical protein